MKKLQISTYWSDGVGVLVLWIAGYEALECVGIVEPHCNIESKIRVPTWKKLQKKIRKQTQK